MFIIKVVNAISKNVALLKIKSIPANCPADVRLVIEIITAIKGFIPPLAAIIPKVIDTEI